MVEDLEEVAQNPDTPPTVLQELAGNHPSLRPLIAMNPSAYPGLLKWLATLDDPAVTLALSQREATLQAAAVHTGAVQRASVMGSNAPRWQPVATPGPQDAGRIPTQVAIQPLPDSKTGRGAILALVAAGAVLVVGLGFLLWTLFGTSHSPNALEDADQIGLIEDSTDLEADDEQVLELPEAGLEEEAQEEEVEEELPILFPAPASALNVPAIVAPSGNIACELGEEGVTCTIYRYNFDEPSLRACDSQPATMQTVEPRATIDCTTPMVPTSGTTLAYGDYATFEGGACLSDMSGFSCWDVRTGSGFAVAREGFMTGNSGPIYPGQFWWH